MPSQEPQIVTLLDGSQVIIQPMTLREKIWSMFVSLVVIVFAIWALVSCMVASKPEKSVLVEFPYEVKILHRTSIFGAEWDTYWTSNTPQCTQNAFGTYDCESIGGYNYDMWNRVNTDFAITGAVITWVKNPKGVLVPESLAKKITESTTR